MNTSSEVINAIESAISGAIENLFAEHRKESFYYISLITTGEGLAPFLSAWSWEALERISSQQASPAAARREMKWSYADSPYCCYGDALFADVRRIFSSLPAPPLGRIDAWCEEVAWRISLMEEAVRRLDRAGLFGSDEARRGRVILVEVVPPDRSNTERALRLNPISPILQEWLREAGEW